MAIRIRPIQSLRVGPSPSKQDWLIVHKRSSENGDSVLAINRTVPNKIQHLNALPLRLKESGELCRAMDSRGSAAIRTAAHDGSSIYCLADTIIRLTISTPIEPAIPVATVTERGAKIPRLILPESRSGTIPAIVVREDTRIGLSLIAKVR